MGCSCGNSDFSNRLLETRLKPFGEFGEDWLYLARQLII